MANYLTKRQREILLFLQTFIEEKGYSPSLAEIGEGLGLSSLATVHAHLRNLEKKKRIMRSWNRSRSIEIQSEEATVQLALAEAPLLGRVAAGSPIEAVAEDETIEVPREFLRGGETFALKVRGDSMIEEQICDGDTILVERRETAENGETVVALVNGREATVKKFFREPDGRIRLQPANETMEPIMLPADACNIQGVVIGLLRKY